VFDTPTFEDIRSAILRDTLSLDPSADVSADSDHYVHASRLASCAVGQYAHQHWIVRQMFPDTADAAYLERHAGLRGLRRRSPTAAAGTAAVRGTANAAVTVGAQIRAGNRFYRVTEAARIGSAGTATVGIAAVEPGETANAANIAAQFMAAPAGVASECTVNAVGGTDTESDASLLARLLEIIRRPPAGGNKYDYKNWALNVDGVTSAYVYPLRRGLGTVDIAVTSAGGVPSDDIVRAVQTYIDEMRPVTAKESLVLKPSTTSVAVTAAVKLDGTDLAAATRAINAALAEYFGNLIPGDALVASQIEAVISNVPGVVDRRLTAPAASRAADVAGKIEWFRLGGVSITVAV
jgi:uncharacterized phage protein gp47/JayE